MARFAIAFDLEQDMLRQTYGNPSYQNAYGDIKKVLARYGFSGQQGSVYFGDDSVDAVRTVMVAQRLARDFPWFVPSVRDIRMLRIEDDNDLMQAIRPDEE